MILIIGNITFHHFSDEEIEKFKKLTERKALVHSILVSVECKDKREALDLGEEAIGFGFESYLVPDVFEDDSKLESGEIIYECENNNLPIDVDSFKKEYLN